MMPAAASSIQEPGSCQKTDAYWRQAPNFPHEGPNTFYVL